MTAEALTSRGIEVIALVANGHTNHEIGQLLSLSHETVNDRLRAVYTALGARNRTHAVALAIRDGHLNPDRIQPATRGVT